MTCNVKLSTCGGSPNLETAINHITWEKACIIIAIGNGYFRDIEVTNDETGEVLYSRYVAEDVFEQDVDLATFYKGLAEVLR